MVGIISPLEITINCLDIKTECSYKNHHVWSNQGLKYLFEVPDAVLATETFLLAINQQEMVG